MVIRILAAGLLLFVGFLIVAVIWYFWSSLCLSLSFMTEEERKEMWRKTISGEHE